MHDFFHKHAIVESGRKHKKAITFNGSLEVGRIINVSFDGHHQEESFGYALMTQEVVKSDLANKTIETRMTLPESPPDKETFENWVYQSINQSAGDIYKRVVLENTFSKKYGASYLTDSPFIFSLLDQIVPIGNNIQMNTVNVLMDMNLPFLEGVSSEALMKVRLDEGEAFENFRLELDKQLRELRQIEDPNELKFKTENIIHDLTAVQIRQVDQKIKSLRKKFFTEAAVVVASLCGAIQTGGFTLPITLIAALTSYKSMTEYQRQKSENPTYFLWRVLKKSS